MQGAGAPGGTPAGWGALAPIALQVGGQLMQGRSQQQAADYNATAKSMEAKAALNQSNVQEQTQRQQGREFLGRQQAAIGAAGIGYGGSAGREVEQSATNAELDALSTRYRGQFTAYGYNTEATAEKYEGTVAARRGLLLAGGSLLRGTSGAYSGSGLGLGY